MARTFTEQGCVPPSSTNSLNADGEGMHTYFPYDLVRGLNNLGTYVNNHWHYVQGHPATTTDAYGRVFNFNSANAQVFLFQVPVFIPLWAVRMVWTAGARCVTTSMSAVTAYLSRAPYVATSDATANAFDTTKLPTGYRSHAVSVSLTTGQYSLADDSSTGITPIDDGCTVLLSIGTGFQTKRKAYLVVTGTGVATIGVEDFSCWFLPS